MTMKMISSTSKMSMSGTTFISAIAPPLLSPTDIPMVNLLSACESRALQAIKPRQVGSGAALLTQQTNGANTCPATAERLSSSDDFNQPTEKKEAERVFYVPVDSARLKGRVDRRPQSEFRPPRQRRRHTWLAHRSSRRRFYRDGKRSSP